MNQLAELLPFFSREGVLADFAVYCASGLCVVIGAFVGIREEPALIGRGKTRIGWKFWCWLGIAVFVAIAGETLSSFLWPYSPGNAPFLLE